MVDAKILGNMFLESYELLVSKKEYLNQINVFPVPDGDTGINIAITMEKVVNEIKKLQESNQGYTLAEMADAISEGAFKGAKGNSGVILSQFIEGFTNRIQTNEPVTPADFAQAVKKGSEFAYEAVLKPQEGTILTVAREMGSSAIEYTRETRTWSDTMIHSFKVAQEVTKDTPNLLKDLKSSGVVDSGALGFVYLVEGWHNVVLKEAGTLDVDDEILKEMENLHNTVDLQKTAEELAFRFCTEAFIINAKSELELVREELSPMGDSFMLIDIGNKSDYKMKLHIHTNEPIDVINRFTKHGALHSVKIDDMLQQSIEAHE